MKKTSARALRAAKPLSIAATIAALLAAHSPAARADLAGRYAFSIPPQPLSSALIQFSKQADVQVVGAADTLCDLDTAGVSGQYTGREALQLLLGAHPLVFEEVTNRSVRILPHNADAPSAQVISLGVSNAQTRNAVRLAQADLPAGAPRVEAGVRSDEDAHSERRIELEEVIVTGTHIRGAQGSASPVLRFDRQDIERSGFATAEQFIHSLPQNFSGGATVMTATAIRGGEGSANNLGQGAGVNLRGLGNDATLVLLNGRRLAAPGMGNFVDLSLIPLGAVERIEVLTDGASAIYGSDAVGGVVNLITRKEYDGIETRVRYGAVVDGDHDELQVGQMLGHRWDSGSALLSYDYYDRSALSSEDRYPAADDNPNDLIGVVEILPPEERHGVLASVYQNVTDDVGLYFDALYSQRDTRSEFFLGSSQVWDSHVEQYGGTLGATFDFGSTWQADVAGGSSRSDTARGFTFASNPTRVTITELKVVSFDAKADGTLFYLPTGAVRLAVGGHYRSEHFNTNSAPESSRNIRAVFGELLLPVLGGPDGGAERQRLELTLAGRYEEYSDFGSTTDPKFGLLWAPVPSVSLRGTYGTSFRAPLFSELDTSATVPVALPIPDPTAPDGTLPTIVIQGNSADLQPQDAETWTAGLDFAPTSLPGLAASITYFSIDFRNRIAMPIPVVQIFTGAFLHDPRYASVVTHAPDIAAVNAWFTHPNFINQAAGATPADVRAIADVRFDNVARRREEGVDFSLSRAWETAYGDFTAQLAGTYLLEFEDQVVSGAPFASQLNTVSFPVDLRMRNSLAWRRGDFGVIAFVNYIDEYRDVRPGSRGHVASWTTVDLTLDYDTGRRFEGAWLDNVVVSLSAQNLLDKAPPFSASLTPNGIDFDPTNANPLGRFVALQVRKTW